MKSPLCVAEGVCNRLKTGSQYPASPYAPKGHSTVAECIRKVRKKHPPRTVPTAVLREAREALQGALDDVEAVLAHRTLVRAALRTRRN